MKVFKYENYAHYKKSQIDANVKKLHCVWAGKECIKCIQAYVETADKILCHGVRNGKELEFFDEVYNPSHIVGTDISPTVNEIEKYEVYQTDFHDPIKYTDYFDIVYTNSFDHSYAPRVALKTFNDQLKIGGHLVIELPLGVDNHSTEMDPLMIERKEYIELLNEIDHELVGMFDIEHEPDREATVVVSKK